MKKFIILVFLILFCEIPQSFSEEATIKINTNEVANTPPISQKLFGGFVEFLLDYINGTNGMWAQELKDRGLDLNAKDFSSSEEWKIYVIGKDTKSELLKGGYNLNGQYFQRLTVSNNNSQIGIYQTVYINDTVKYDFYLYAKSPQKTNLIISYIDTITKKTYFQTQINIDSLDWKKYKIVLPKIKDMPNWVGILISIDTISDIDIDELSLMQSDNEFGVRKEYYDLFKIWKPGILRYPGGWFADSQSSIYEYFINDIDQRKSPNLSVGNINQRLDFGLHEYLLFCENLNIEPQITVNSQYGTAKSAWDWIEYCIGDSLTPNGQIRSSLGHPKPFNLNYVEIGNENWSNVNIYLDKYIKIYDYIKERNKSVQLIVNLNHWDGLSISNVLNYINKKIDCLSFHPMVFIEDRAIATSEQIFLSTVGSSEGIGNTISNYSIWLKDNGYNPKIKQAITEWWSSYGNSNDWLIDTNSRNSSLESALWNVGTLNVFIKHTNEIPFANRTNGIGMIKRGFSKDNIRKIYGNAPFWGISMLSNHHGENLISNIVDCQNFSLTGIDGLPWVNTAKRLDVTTTKSKDSIYISVINRHPNENVETSIIIDNVPFYGRAKVYYLNSNKYTDCNTENEPLKVVPKELKTIIKGIYSLPPHSYSILAIEYPKNSNENVELVSSFKSDDIVSSKIKISLNEYPQEFTRLKIYDLVGVEVFSSKLNMNQLNYTFWLESLTDGIYFGNVGNNYFKFLKKSE
ncbi:MAG: hypothetical protein NTW25_09315 [Candidatus Kapabacteria bacterium]|nr:hypothetical protein [Candidatus Kapabacteria bacterium]